MTLVMILNDTIELCGSETNHYEFQKSHIQIKAQFVLY